MTIRCTTFKEKTMTTERSPVMSGTTKSDQEALNRIFESEKKRRDAEAVETAKALEGWREKYKTERTRVVGPNLQARLDSYAREHQRQSLQDGGTSDPAREGDARKVRLDSFHFAHDPA